MFRQQLSTAQAIGRLTGVRKERLLRWLRKEAQAQMTNHPNRTRKHVLVLCPRGFRNETTYVSVSEEEFAEADAYLNTLVDDVDSTSRWLAPGRKLIARNGARIDFTWPQYKALFINPL